MYDDYDLNALVNEGKGEVLAFMKDHIFPQSGESNSVKSMFFLALSKERAELDIPRSRAMIIQENIDLLDGFDTNDRSVLFAMARAAGRISQMQDCLGAVRRVLVTMSGEEGAQVQAARKLQAFLEQFEKKCVTMVRTPQGCALVPLDETVAPACSR